MTDTGDRLSPAPLEAGDHPGSGSAAKFVLLLALCAVAFAGFASLGVWQVQRRAWKLALIDRVDRRIHAPARPAPGPAAWPHVTADRYGYLHVTAVGRYDNDRETLVQANTELGPGFWVLTPFETGRGFTVLVNRGFVAAERRDESGAHGAISGTARVTGLLRITEPRGAFLRRNDPATDRWYSRDVAAIARARGLHAVAPYFIDAERAPVPPGAPVGGLTVVRFRNAHLQYALTWFGLALLALIGGVLLIRDRMRR